MSGEWRVASGEARGAGRELRGARRGARGASIQHPGSSIQHPASSIQPRAGFSLVELVITVLIISILTAVAAPKFARTLHRNRVEAACRRIKTDLALARQTAISKSASQTVTFAAATDSYSLPGMAALDRPSATYEVKLREAPTEVDLASASFGSDEQVVFDLYGSPDSGGVVTVGCGGFSGTVTLDANTGAASIP